MLERNHGSSARSDFCGVQKTVAGTNTLQSSWFGPLFNWQTKKVPRLALVIGNGAYPFPLKNPANDAWKVSNALRSRGFEVQTLIDSKKSELNTAIDRFRRQLAPGGIGLVYYGGLNCRDGHNEYFVPVDLPKDTKLDRLSDYSVNITEFLKPIDVLVEGKSDQSGHVTIFSASKGQYADDGPRDGNSPFAVAFEEALNNKKSELFDVVRDVTSGVRVRSKGKQVPCAEGTFGPKFFFNQPGLDRDVGLLKIIMFDSCREHPQKTAT